MKTWAQMTEPERNAWRSRSAVMPSVPRTIPTRMVLASGAGQLPAVTPPYTRKVAGLLSWSAEDGEAHEVCLALGTPIFGGVSTQPQWIAARSPQRELCVVLEIGAGNSSISVKCDIRTGFLRLPSCSYVKASLLLTPGTAPANENALEVPATLVSGISEADGLTYTDFEVANGAIEAPPGATSVQLLNSGRLTYAGGLAQIISEPTSLTPVVAPPFSPVPIAWSGGGAITFTYTREITQNLPGHLLWGLL